MNNDEFQAITRCRWEELRATSFHTDSIFAFIDGQVDIMSPSINQNFARWNVLGTYLWPNPSPLANSHAQEITFLKEWLTARLQWMDDNIGSTCQMSVSTTELDALNVFEIVPNPAYDKLNLLMKESLLSEIEGVAIINALGQRTDLTRIGTDLTFDISDLNAGIYFVTLQIGTVTYLKKVVIK
ncbi:MAG: T9SS type A sorting domain-containing protein [Saprospiraceae bacterium]